MHESVTFGSCRFEPVTQRLWSGAREVKLTPKAATVLAILLRRAGEPGRFLGGVGIDVGGDDPGAVFGPELHRRTADARSGAGDDRDLAFKQSLHRCSLSHERFSRRY